MSRGEKLETMCDFILEEENIWCIGIYAFQKLAEQCGEEEWNSLDRLDQVHQKYERMKKGMVDDGKEIFVHGLDDGFSLRGRGMS